ncbi:adenosylcobalamin-dependent ribonucleoside-diphosphate reductase [Thermodesulfovibrio sp. 1176]|uniref:adenosylcobalamin-dependent ribonucleoside-diphosphate reductase n=1 Tax=Thermodesulfovibrio sp. 1176 TaxID=3043424 RepID=UPI002482EC8A|nr:adenosylcobalamin-dependent ribonucleoside-diphosphate reductase [Thermodesulfovibrio sp. 1176]MDI1472096.1 adenosylcobalamin-dependent ribonucleoside-diphosphate reductase [Thermodesulfovibrio sp. 1176]
MLSQISQLIWEKKYKTEKESSIEETFARVAKAIADNKEQERKFFDIMSSLKFIPGGRILAYAGRGNEKATLSNCYVMSDPEDSMDGIMKSLHECALTMKAGGGIGLNFSNLRPAGDYVRGTDSKSSGPVSFLKMWNAMSRTIAGVGHRKGAMLASMNINHPDIENFISAKRENSVQNPVLEMFNISVAITDDFMKAVKEDKEWQLKFNGKIYKTVKARDIWHLIVENNWAKAEPGVIFIDRVNRLNNLWYCERITTTNPCGEQPLPPHGACTLGAVNLTQFVAHPFTPDASIYIDDLADTVATAVEFLDNTVDKNYYPLESQKQEATNKRRIGLGIMGLGSALAMLGVKYNSEEALKVVDVIMTVIRDNAYMKSVKLAREKGSFPLFDKEKYLYGNPESFAYNLPEEIKKEIKKYGIRNGCLLTVAPTGSISQLANNVSSGVEPVFSLSYIRRNYNEEFEVNDYAWEMYKNIEVATNGNKPEFFVTAHETSPEWHIKVMAQVQKYVDASISKTINLPKEITVEQMMDIYMLAYESGLKGCTTYRVGSLETEILSTEKKKEEKDKKEIKIYERPYKLGSTTYKVKIPGTQHAYYLTFSYEKTKEGKNKPIELFINTKDTSMEEWTKLIGRMVSAVFRQVDDPTFLIEEFKQIYSPSGFFSPKRKKYVPSLQAEFGEVMKDFFIEIGLLDPEIPIDEYENNLGKCPACGKKGAIYEEGCIKCLLCGYSKCG